jgi:hypothetical protein
LFQTLCKVGTGYNFQELTELREKLSVIAVPWDVKSPPEHLSHWKIAKRDDRPHVYIPPEKSFVMQLKCAEIVESISFSCGYTCRFPRVQRIRYDKSYRDILCVRDIIAAKNRPRNVMSIDLGHTHDQDHGRKRSRKNPMEPTRNNSSVRRREQGIDEQFRLTSLKKVEQHGRIFHGYTFCVLENDFVFSNVSGHTTNTEASSSTTLPVDLKRKYTRDQVYYRFSIVDG